MAYTIISQNNSTTTLSDGVNTITVPSRVNLTSGNFTIVEVNNNMATLEDGDGNVYRDIPCVATLAGEGGGGGSALPDQTGHSGEFLTTDGTDASWSDKPLVNTATGTLSFATGNATATGNYSLALGAGASATANSCVAFGEGTVATKEGSVLINARSSQNKRCVAIGRVQTDNMKEGSILINSTSSGANMGSTNANSFYIMNSNGLYELLSSDGTIPTARLTKVNSTITLAAAGWSGGSQTVTVSGVTSTSVVLVAPDPSDTADYVSAGILCTSQTTDSLTFTATTTPTSDIDVNIVCL